MFIFNGIVTWHCGFITLHPAWPFTYRWWWSERFWVYRFWYVCGDTFFTLFTSKLIDHVIAAKCPYDESPVFSKRGNTFSGEREAKNRNTYISLNQIVLSIIKL